MPLYEYVCRACGVEIERLQKFNDAPLTTCPDCGKPELRKKISAAAFRLKGSGWYETDFKKDNRRNIAADSSADNGGGAEAKPSGSGDKNGSKDNKNDSQGKSASAPASKATGKKDSDARPGAGT